MNCECGGILEVTRVEEYPVKLSKEERLVYDRICDVKCLKCGKVIYSQPYDFGSRINVAKKIEEK